MATRLRLQLLLVLVLFIPSILSAQSVLQFPRAIAATDVSTGIAVGNPTTAEASVTFTAYQADGSPLTGGGAKNPVTVTIPPAGQSARLFSELFGVTSFNGWVQATSSTSGLTGFFLNLNNSLTDVDGAGSTAPSSDILLPIAVEDSVTRTEVTIVNVNQEAATATLTLYSQSGAVLLTKEVSLPARGLARQTLSVLFNTTDFSTVSHIRVRADRPVVAHEVLADYLMPGTTLRRETAALTGHEASSETNYVLPQFATGGGAGGFLSLIGLVNGSGIAQDVTLTAYKDDGTLSTAGSNPRKVTLEGNGALRTTVGEFFGFPADTLTTGWIKVSSTLGFVTSFIGYGNLASPSFAMVEGTPAGNATRNAVFSQVAEGDGFYTGLTVVNPGSAPATVEFYTLRPDGTTVGKTTIQVGPNEHRARLFREFLAASLGQTRGWGYLRSSSPVVAAVLFGSSNGYALANVPQQLTASDFLPPAQTTASITGTVRANGAGVAGAVIQLKGPTNDSKKTDDAGRYVFSQLPAGDYKISASNGNALVSPAERQVTLAKENVEGVDFESQSSAPSNPPVISFVTPSSAFAGSTGFSMRVLGANFTRFSVVSLNGQPLSTTYVSELELQAVVPASLMSKSGIVTIVVQTPPPGGGGSVVLNFTVNEVPKDPLIEGYVTVGNAPAGVAIDTARHRALVTNESSDSVSIFDIPSRVMVETVSVGRSPAEGIAIHKGKDIALVANAGDNTVSVIDLQTNKVKQVIAVGRLPLGVAVNENTNRAYVINRDDDTISVLNLDTDPISLTGTPAPTGDQPSGIAVSTRLNQAIVTNRGANTATVFDLGNMSPIRTFDTGQIPRGVALNPDTDVAMIANAGSNTVSLISLAEQRVLSQEAVGTAPTGVAIHQVTNSALVTNSGASDASSKGGALATVTVMNLDDRRGAVTVPVGDGPFGVAVDQGLQNAVVANFFGANATVIRIPNPTPKINDIEPKTFPVGGGSFTITLKGTGFLPTSVITLNGQQLPTQYISKTELRGTVSGALLDQLLQVSNIESGTGGKPVVLRAGAPQFNVGVSNPCPPCGGEGGDSPQNNNPNTQIQPQNPKPVLISMSPTEIPVGNDLTLTVSGSNFNATSTFNFGGLQVVPVAVSLNSITVNIPRAQLTAGDVPVSVTNPAPGGGTTDVLTFKVTVPPNPSPEIANVNPGSVNAGSGAVTIQLTGTGFIASTTASLAGVNGVVSGNTITFALSDAITANPGTLNGLVTNPGPGGGTATFSVNVLSVPPVITGFTPAGANAGAASAVINVTGANFRNGSTITVAGIPIPTTFVSSTQLTGTIPEPVLRRAGEVRIGVTSPPPGVGSVEGGLFTISGVTPILISVSPNKATRQTTPLTVQLTGTGFSLNTVVFAGTTRLDSVFNSATSMTATIPAALMNIAGTFSITVTTPPPGGGTSAPVIFIVENPTPVIDSVTPNSIAGSVTDAVLTVTGRNFVSGAVVRFGEKLLVTTFVSSTQLTAPLPPPLPYGRHAITVANPLPSTPSNAVEINITALRPIIDSLTPNPARAGNLIQITGRNFGPSSLILLRGIIAFPTTAIDTTSLTAVLPITTPLGAYEITVLNPAVIAGATPLVSDPVTLNVVTSIPTIDEISPTSGLSGSTISLQVSGANFLPGATIQMGTLPVVTTFVSSTALTGTTTLGDAGSVAVTVMNPGGFVSNSAPFTIHPLVPVALNPVPTISSIFPGGALVNSETLSLNVTGTGFFDLTTVTFGGTTLAISARSATSLTATVPASLMTTGGTKPVVVTNPGPGGGSATTSFIVNTVQMSPVTVERIPGGTQQFVLINPPVGTFIWSVNSIDNGNSTFGTITSGGLYTAPSVVPSPATFPVCARLSTNALINACASVTIRPTPSAGNDLVVFNDLNPFDNTGMADANNKLMMRNLVNFTGVGPRATGSVVQFDCGRNSGFSSFCTSGMTLRTEVTGLGLTITDVNSSATSPILSIPANVKAIFLWLPTVPYAPAEVNTLKKFAEDGGRIVFVGEHSGFYGSSIPLQNDFLTKMGAIMRNVGQAIDCGFNVLPGTSLRTHQITTGMTQVTIACASVITLGPNDFPLFYDLSNTKVLAGVAKIDVAPLPAAAPTVTGVNPSSGPILAPTNVTITGTNFIRTCSENCPVTFGTNISLGSNIAVTNIVVVNSTTINATLTPAFNSTLGAKTVTATTQSGSGGSATFTVTAAGAPTITGLTPAVGVQNSSITVTITGTNFTAGATAAIDGTGVTLGTPNVTSSSSMTVQFTIASDAPISLRNVAVTTGGGTSGTKPFGITTSNAFTSFSKVWVGGAPGAVTDWMTSANWSPSGVPVSTDNVFIPTSAVHMPVVNTVRTIKDLYLAPGATLTIDSTGELNSSGNVFAGDAIEGAGALVMTGSSKFLAGTLQNLLVSGTISSMGNVNVRGYMTIFGSGNYTLAGKNLGVGGGFLTNGTATLTMTNASDYLQVGSTAKFAGGSTAGKLTAGAIELLGDFVQSNDGGSTSSFSASGTHITRFVGGTAQNVTFASALVSTSHFGRVEIQNTAGGSVKVDSPQSALALDNLELKTADSKLTGTGIFTANGNFPAMAVGATVTIASLCIGGDVDGLQTIGAGTVTAFGTNKTLGGTFTGNVLIGGTISAFSGSTISGSLTVMSGGQFDLNGKVVNVTLDFVTNGSGKLKMVDSFDRLNVVRDAKFEGGSTAGLLSGGLLSIGRNFKQSTAGGVNDSFSASGTHEVKFIGTATQLVEFASPGASNSHFQIVEFANAAGGEVKVESPNGALALAQAFFTTGASKLTGTGVFDIRGNFSTFSGATVSIASLIVGGNVDATNGIGPALLTMDGTATLKGTLTGNLQVSGTTTLILGTSVSGSVTVVSGGLIDLGSQTLTVGTDFVTSGSGKLKMVNDGGQLAVGQDAKFQGGSTAGNLTNGLITVARNFVQSTAGGVNDSFSASGSHKVKFIGGGTQSIQFSSPSSSNSHFQNVEIANGSGGETTVPNAQVALALGNLGLTTATAQLTGAGTFIALGNLSLISGSSITIASLSIGGTADVPVSVAAGLLTLTGGSATLGGTFTGNVAISGTAVAAATVNISGSLTVSGGSFDLNGKIVNVTQNFTTSTGGTLKMMNANDRLNVTGSVTFGGGSTAGKLTAGILTVAGAFTQSTASGVNDSFAASGAHTVKFVGTGTQAVSFSSSSATNSQFNNIEIANSGGGDGVKIVGDSVDIRVANNVTLSGLTPKLTLDKKLTYFGGLFQTESQTIVHPENLIDGDPPTA